MAIRWMFGKKKKRGFTEKQRTKEEVDREYSHHAMMYGHISRTMFQSQRLLDDHLAALDRLAIEGSKLPPDKPKTEAETPVPEPTPA